MANELWVDGGFTVAGQTVHSEDPPVCGRSTEEKDNGALQDPMSLCLGEQLRVLWGLKPQQTALVSTEAACRSEPHRLASL